MKAVLCNCRVAIAVLSLLLTLPGCTDHDRQITAVKEQAAKDLAVAKEKAAKELTAAKELAAANERAAAEELAKVKEKAERDKYHAGVLLAATKQEAAEELASVRAQEALKLAAAKPPEEINAVKRKEGIEMNIKAAEAIWAEKQKAFEAGLISEADMRRAEMDILGIIQQQHNF